MAWFKKERKPRPSQRERLEIPRDAWEKCEVCGHLDIREKFERGFNVCPECGDHRRISAEEYIELLTDEGTWRELYANLRATDPLKFEHYPDRVTAAIKKAGPADALYAGTARIEGMPYNLGVMNFAFMGGSMGSVVGEKIARLARRSADKRLPLVLVCTSGGARMQEGVLSLMQMAKTSAALRRHHDAGLLCITVLTDPTLAGVSASFAFLGDVIIAEPHAMIGFTGKIVIEQTIKKQLPEGFQESEFLLEHGQIDMVVERKNLRSMLSRIVSYIGPHGGSVEEVAGAVVEELGAQAEETVGSNGSSNGVHAPAAARGSRSRKRKAK
jgi:acetyl-CoA carboxylase carboxyl transferase subunit beta